MAGTTRLLQVDIMGTVMCSRNEPDNTDLVYTAYGHETAPVGITPLLRLNGQLCEPASGVYLLGNGYRGFNPVLMRFHSPDSYSPFGEGGMNAYAYCGGNPAYRSDPTGHIPNFGALISATGGVPVVGAMRVMSDALEKHQRALLARREAWHQISRVTAISLPVTGSRPRAPARNAGQYSNPVLELDSSVQYSGRTISAADSEASLDSLPPSYSEAMANPRRYPKLSRHHDVTGNPGDAPQPPQYHEVIGSPGSGPEPRQYLIREIE